MITIEITELRALGVVIGLRATCQEFSGKSLLDCQVALEILRPDLAQFLRDNPCYPEGNGAISWGRHFT